MDFKRIFIIIAACISLTVSSLVPRAAAEGAAISFKQKEYNFGMVDEKGGGVSHEFEFTNTGDAPLVIISATASCGCTRPTYPTEPIAPGKTGVIKVTYLPEGRPGEFVRMVKVRTNADNAKKINLKITGSVKK
ncbi:MAG: DUF1573 domain-containing protein [Muribaculaceae bacterium]|nr:DUF1573 domain-containing protein [Muribaculaceae bacterium]